MLVLLAGCGAREGLPLEEGECKDLQITDVPECTRPSPEALPLARLVGLPGENGVMNGFSLAEDDGHLYFVSESRVFRVSKNGGEPEPLTPPHTASSGIALVGDFLYWEHEDVVSRMPVKGGPIERVVEVPGEWWRAGPNAIVSWSPADPWPVRRTSLATGETTVLWEGLQDESILVVGVDEEHAYFVEQDLYRVPLAGGPAEHLVGNGGTVGPSPSPRGFGLLVTDAHVYFDADDPAEKDPGYLAASVGVYRIAKANPHTPERVASGYLVRAVQHGDDLFMELLMPANDGPPTYGEIVRLPQRGGEVEPIADGDSFVNLGGDGYMHRSEGIAASDCYVYFHLSCDDHETYRLVAMPYGAAAYE